MNLILGIIVLIISVIIGYFLSEKYTKRRKFFCSFNDFNNNLRSQVGFGKNSLLKILNDKKTLKDDYYILMSQRINNQNEIKDNNSEQTKKVLLSVLLFLMLPNTNSFPSSPGEVTFTYIFPGSLPAAITASSFPENRHLLIPL